MNVDAAPVDVNESTLAAVVALQTSSDYSAVQVMGLGDYMQGADWEMVKVWGWVV